MRRADITGFFKLGHPGTLISAFLYFAVSTMVWIIMGALGVYIAEDFGLSPTQKGLMVAVPILAGSLLRLPLGMAADYFGPKKTGTVGLILTLVPLLAGWLWANTLGGVFLVGFMLGIAGASFAAALPIVSRWYPPQFQGLTLGIVGAGNGGTVLAALFAPRLAEQVGWHGVFGLACVPVLLTLALFLLLAKESPEQPAPLKLMSNLGLYLFLLNKWYFDELYDRVFVNPAKRLGRGLWKSGDGNVIDGVGPDGIAAAVINLSRRASKLQTGYIYHYAFAMLVGVALLVTWYMFTAAGSA